MDDADAVCGLERGGDFNRGLERVLECQRSFFETAFKRLALEVLHHEIRRAALVADVVQGADVGMVELGNDSGFAVEAVAELTITPQPIRRDLDGDDAMEGAS